MNSIIINLALQFRYSQFTAAGAITLWVYDYLITSAEEITLVWQNQAMSWLKLLFLVNRNLPIINSYFSGKILLPTIVYTSSKKYYSTHERHDSSCQVTITIVVICNLLQIISTHSIFTMRVYAISRGYPKFRILLLLLFLVLQVASIIFATLVIVQSLPLIAYFPQGHTCAYLRTYSNLYPVSLALSSLTLETIIFAATIYFAVHFQKEIADLRGARSGGIIKRLHQHGVQYYMLVFLSRLSSTLGLYVAPIGFQFLFPTIQFYLASTMTSRLVLSLQREILNSRNRGAEAENATTTKTNNNKTVSSSSFFPPWSPPPQKPNHPPQSIGSLDAATTTPKSKRALTLSRHHHHHHQPREVEAAEVYITVVTQRA
ncbi:hypothetical protein FRB91_003455 [Serendipita sp. 411]|nr:hypothetical protein FRC18_011861 [Serendipita sp. 400]KAG8854498.1 hypothetical protein FRB91_003455 [Serendipita sp. 411]